MSGIGKRTVIKTTEGEVNDGDWWPRARTEHNTIESGTGWLVFALLHSLHCLNENVA